MFKRLWFHLYKVNKKTARRLDKNQEIDFLSRKHPTQTSGMAQGRDDSKAGFDCGRSQIATHQKKNPTINTIFLISEFTHEEKWTNWTVNINDATTGKDRRKNAIQKLCGCRIAFNGCQGHLQIFLKLWGSPPGEAR